MKKNTVVFLAVVLILPAILMTVSCAKQAVESTPQTTPAPAAAPAPAEPPAAMTPAPRPAPSGPDEAALRAQELQRQRQAAMAAFTNEMIHFEFDSAVLSPEAQQILSGKAAYLNNNNVKVTIQGHCDERGTDAYNLALGERRAEAAKAYLVNLGIAADRLDTISYGEERPLDPGRNEAAYAKNRRDQFVIQ